MLPTPGQSLKRRNNYFIQKTSLIGNQRQCCCYGLFYTKEITCDILKCRASTHSQLGACSSCNTKGRTQFCYLSKQSITVFQPWIHTFNLPQQPNTSIVSVFCTACWDETYTAKKNLLNCLQDMQKLSGSFSLMHSNCADWKVTVPKYLHMQTCLIWMVAWLDAAKRKQHFFIFYFFLISSFIHIFHLHLISQTDSLSVSQLCPFLSSSFPLVCCHRSLLGFSVFSHQLCLSPRGFCCPWSFILVSLWSLRQTRSRRDELMVGFRNYCLNQLELHNKLTQMPAVDMQHAPAKLSSKLHLFAYLTCNMLQPSFHPNSTSWFKHFCRMVGVTTDTSWEFLHVNCRQLRNSFLQCCVFCTSTLIARAKLLIKANGTKPIEAHSQERFFESFKKHSRSGIIREGDSKIKSHWKSLSKNRSADHDSIHCKKNFLNCLKLICRMLHLVELLWENYFSKNRSFLGISACQLQAVEQFLLCSDTY
ncbi:hypothetical protein VP01_1971g3 [Puccinia sorghi]|uniref:Uncharacterized protein n=1 Tax=Puccinia sorghi TaxID=27349 RepID=A0A0L6VCB6_9BASI|nr:hypothetical protein VP01_1971g3 [Puccinia sorghi]